MINGLESIVYEEKYYEKTSGYTYLYFIGPKASLEITGKDYPEAIASCISLEFLGEDEIIPSEVIVSISPTREVDGALEDYDWTFIDIPIDEVVSLIEIAGGKINV